MVLCFASTIHKVQGSTLQNVVLSTVNIRTPGIIYVALSRVIYIEGLYLFDFHENSINVSEATKEEMKRLQTDMKLETVKILLQEQNLNQLRILWLNTRSLQHEKTYLNSDPYIGLANIIAFTET